MRAIHHSANLQNYCTSHAGIQTLQG